MRLLIAAMLSLAAPAAAQSPPICMPIDELVRILRDEYRERLAEAGAMGNGARLLLFASENGETWTLVVLAPSGIGCVGPTGANWRATARGA